MLIVLFLGSCKPNESIDATTSPVAKDKFVKFEGTTVRLPKEASEKLFFLESQKEIMQYAVNEVEKSLSNARVNAEDFISQIRFEVIMEILERESKKYPQLDFSKEQLDERVLEQVKKDFPDLKTQKEAVEKSETIAKYYEKMLREDLIKELTKSKLRGGRTNFSGFGNAPSGWGWIAIVYPSTVSRVVPASIEATKLTNQNFTEDDRIDGRKGNAFKHSVWNAISVAAMRVTGFSRNTALDNVRTVTSAWEAEAIAPTWLVFLGYGFGDISITQGRGAAHAMDLHNNLVGRTFMYQNMGFWPWQTPGVSTIVSEMQSKANAISFNSDENAIVNIYGSNVNDSWDRMYSWHYDDTYHGLVKTQ